jgi:hypothetical protein
MALVVLFAPVAQPDRALPSGGKGHRFEFCRVHQKQVSFQDFGAVLQMQVAREIVARLWGFEVSKPNFEPYLSRVHDFRLCCANAEPTCSKTSNSSCLGTSLVFEIGNRLVMLEQYIRSCSSFHIGSSFWNEPNFQVEFQHSTPRFLGLDKYF